MKQKILFLLTLLVASVGTQAKSWKIGPSSVTGMNFASINAAMNSSNVSAGDTLYLDQYYNESAEQTVTKAVVIIGTGYDTSTTDEQVVATLTSSLTLKADNVVVKSVKLSRVYFYNNQCVLDRCYITNVMVNSSSAGLNHIYSCYIFGTVHGLSSAQYSMLDIQNNVIIYDNYNNCIDCLNSSTIKNNVIINTYSNTNYCIRYVKNSEIANNIILNTYYSSNDVSGDVYASGSGNTIEHNILSRSSSLSYYPTNKIGYGSGMSNLFTQTGNFSDYYKLVDNSPARGYATDGGDVGCHGGMFGCPSGGRPQHIPYFTKVTVGSRTENGKLPVSVTIKIQDE